LNRRFVIEAVMLAIYGQLLMPGRQVEYLIPYSTILELYDMRESPDPVMPDPEEDVHVKEKIGELIAFFEEPLNKKKIEKTIVTPWKKSSPILVNAETTLTIVYAIDNAQFGEAFDPVETELLLTAMREQAPILTDQLEFIDKLIEHEVPVQAFDIEDFEFAVEEDISV
jgi:hypothetical protein